jgi:hypothetical protein
VTTAAIDLTQYTEKRVTLTLKPADGESENRVLEGKVEAASPIGLMFKRKGSGQPDLIPAADVVSIEELPEKAKEHKAKALKPVAQATVKSHLLERHGVTLEWANSPEVSDEDAESYHDSLDHAALLLGHVHKTPETSTTPAEDAIEQAAASTQE